MNVQTVRRGALAICGYAVETTLNNNDADLQKLFSNFFDSGKDELLLGLKGAEPGFFGVEWYTPGHKSFFYLLGVAVDKNVRVPEGAVLKVIPAAAYAVTKVCAGRSLVEAWTEFFYTAIPEEGLKPDEAHGYYFEYYPGHTDGDCELWVPVVKK